VRDVRLMTIGGDTPRMRAHPFQEAIYHHYQQQQQQQHRQRRRIA